MVQLVVPLSDPDLYRVFVVHAKLTAKSEGRVFQVAVTAMAGSDERGRWSSLQRMLNFAVVVLNMLCRPPFSSSLFSRTQGSGTPEAT